MRNLLKICEHQQSLLLKILEDFNTSMEMMWGVTENAFILFLSYQKI